MTEELERCRERNRMYESSFALVNDWLDVLKHAITTGPFDKTDWFLSAIDLQAQLPPKFNEDGGWTLEVKWPKVLDR